MTVKSSVKRDAEIYRLLQATALMKLFHAAHRRDAASIKELSDWVAKTRPEPKDPINPMTVLTKDEIDEALKSALGMQRGKRRQK